MLKLGDFFHLPQLDTLIEQLVADGPGLTIVAGFDPPSATAQASGAGFIPSGRSAIFRILMDEILAARRGTQAIVISRDEAFLRVPRQFRRQVRLALVEPPLTYADRIADAIRRRPGLLVIDQLCVESAAAALEATQVGMRVLAQLNTVFRGAEVARQLLDWDVPRQVWTTTPG